jgi:hypothetical protein
MASKAYADVEDEVPIVCVGVIRAKTPCPVACVTCVPCVHGCKPADECSPCKEELQRLVAESPEFRAVDGPRASS